MPSRGSASDGEVSRAGPLDALMSARGQPLELARQVIAKVADLDLADLGIGLGELDDAGRKRLVGAPQLAVRCQAVSRAAQVQRASLHVLRQPLEARPVGARIPRQRA